MTRGFESGGSWARPTTLPRLTAEKKLDALEWRISVRLDRIHDEALAKFRTLARSTGQRTRTDRVKKFSLEPDAHMKWIYDPQHPDYNSEHAEHLRERRARSISSAPRWMLMEAQINDSMRDASITKKG